MSSAITLGSLGTPEDKRSGFTLSEMFGRNFLEVGTPSEFEIKKSLTQNCGVTTSEKQGNKKSSRTARGR